MGCIHTRIDELEKRIKKLEKINKEFLIHYPLPAGHR